MSFFDEIKSPIDDDKKLRRMVSLYSKGKGSFYNIVAHANGKLTREQQLEHQRNFYKYIGIPAMQTVVDGILKADSTKYEETYKKMMDKAKDDKYKQWDIEDANFHPIDKYKALFEKYDMEQLVSMYLERQGRYSKYVDQKLDSRNKKSDEELKKEFDLSDEDIFIVKTMYKLRDHFDGGDFVMGFHVNKKRLGEAKRAPSTNMKFYINAGADTYQFARELWKKCDERKLNFYFKVARPYSGEAGRVDRMCIYVPSNKAAEYLDVIREVREENPELDYQDPPILSGVVDGWIGMGADRDSKSYNQIRANIISDAIEDVFGTDGDKKDAYEKLRKDKTLLQKLRDRIKSLAKAQEVSEENFAIDEKMKSKMKSIELIDRTKKKSEKDAKKKAEEPDKKEAEDHVKKDEDPDKKEPEDSTKKEEKSDKKKAKESEKKNDEEPTKKNEPSIRENLNELKGILKEMAINYTSDYDAYNKNDARLYELLHILYDQKAKKLNVKESLLEKRMNERQLDSIISNVLVLAQRIDMQSKMGEVSKLTKEEFDYSMKELNNYFAGVIDEERATKKPTDKDDKSVSHERVREHVKRAADKVSRRVPGKRKPDDKIKKGNGKSNHSVRPNRDRSFDRDR